MTSPLGDRPLIDVLTPEATGIPGRFVGPANEYGAMGIYGGHYIGQGLSAAFATVPEPFRAQSLHAYFLQPGDIDTPLEYRVEVLRDGRRSGVRSIAAFQGEAQLFHMLAAFKQPEESSAHQVDAPAVPTAPELIAAREARGEPPFAFPPSQNGWAQMEWAGKSFLDGDTEDPHPLRLWMRVPDADTLSDRQRQVVLGYLSDGPLMFNSILPHGTPFETHWATSIDHSAWFHWPADPSRWMSFDQRSTAAVDGRGMNEGEIHAEDGTLLMTVAQESVMRRLDR